MRALSRRLGTPAAGPRACVGRRGALLRVRATSDENERIKSTLADLDALLGIVEEPKKASDQVCVGVMLGSRGGTRRKGNQPGKEEGCFFLQLRWSGGAAERRAAACRPAGVSRGVSGRAAQRAQPDADEAEAHGGPRKAGRVTIAAFRASGGMPGGAQRAHSRPLHTHASRRVAARALPPPRAPGRQGRRGRGGREPAEPRGAADGGGGGGAEAGR